MPDAPAVALHILAALQAIKLDAPVSGISAGLVGHHDAAGRAFVCIQRSEANGQAGGRWHTRLHNF